MKNKNLSSKILTILYLILFTLLIAVFFGVLAIDVPFVLIPYKNTHLLAIEIGFFLFVAAFITIMSIFIYEVHYLNKLSRAMQKVANGDFSVRLPIKKYDLLFKSFGNFNKMAAELDSTQTLKTDFISHFSHEFKTPITSINGFAELLLHQDIPEDKRKEYLQIIAEESKRLSKLSRQTLRLTKLENQKIITNQKNVEIDEELRKIIISAMPSLESKNLNYELNLDKVNYHTDPELLREVWINLLNNSIKFTPKGGTVFISCKQDKDRVEVVIGNNGPQIEEKEKKKILEKFYQGETNNKSEGLGLGLAIVKQILNLINGNMEIYSTYQGISGAFFKVFLLKQKNN
ncbi:sensor histidine kinase [Lactobacillus agrestimuris]|uniref:sensor histidine kinase n=1 Tax=Lactobacillus agrestimuris TaxID=2941328 RepID=UPI002042E58F|nr:HAMP domain-containing sensor histidine kinase [Lactobacillus agrestimuris]